MNLWPTSIQLSCQLESLSQHNPGSSFSATVSFKQINMQAERKQAEQSDSFPKRKFISNIPASMALLTCFMVSKTVNVAHVFYCCVSKIREKQTNAFLKLQKGMSTTTCSSGRHVVLHVVLPSSPESLRSIPSKMTWDKHKQNKPKRIHSSKKNLMLQYSIHNQQKGTFGGCTQSKYLALQKINPIMHTQCILAK